MTQPFRLAERGRVDRGRVLRFRFDGRAYEGVAGDTLASALLANDVCLVGRSFKYHRPRGIFSAGSEEPNALVTIDQGAGRVTPNLRATQVELYDGLVARSQNRFPSLRFDLGAVAGLAAPLLSAGFYYKTCMGRWWRIAEPAIRRAAGLGHAPVEAADGELGGIRHSHHRHHSGLYRVCHYQVGGVRYASGHIQTNYQQPFTAHLPHRHLAGDPGVVEQHEAAVHGGGGGGMAEAMGDQEPPVPIGARVGLRVAGHEVDGRVDVAPTVVDPQVESRHWMWRLLSHAFGVIEATRSGSKSRKASLRPSHLASMTFQLIPAEKTPRHMAAR